MSNKHQFLKDVKLGEFCKWSKTNEGVVGVSVCREHRADTVPSTLTMKVSSIVTDKVSSTVTDKVSSIVTDKVSSIVTDKVSSVVTDKVSSIVTDKVSSIVTSNEGLQHSD